MFGLAWIYSKSMWWMDECFYWNRRVIRWTQRTLIVLRVLTVSLEAFSTACICRVLATPVEEKSFAKQIFHESNFIRLKDSHTIMIFTNLLSMDGVHPAKPKWQNEIPLLERYLYRHIYRCSHMRFNKHI